MDAVSPLPISAKVVSLEEVRGSHDWGAWHDLARGAPPFLAPDFFALTAPLAGPGDPLVAEAWQAEVLVGALPLLLEHKHLHALRSDHTPSFDYWGASEGIDATWRALLADRRWDVMTLKNVPASSALAQRLPELGERDGCPVVVRPGANHYYFDLPGFESRLSPKFLANLRRVARKAGEPELERLTHLTRSDFEDALSIEAMAWKGRAGTSIGSDPRVLHLYATLARLFGPRGRAALSFLRVQGKRVAMLLSVEDERTLYALKIGYDPSLAASSPGHLMVWLVARDAEQRGLAQLDFVGREDEWKRKWTHEFREHVSLIVYRRSARGLALYALREQVKPHLPERLQSIEGVLRSGCQRGDIVGVHSLVERARGRLDRGLGIKSGLRQALGKPAPKREPLGKASEHPVGSWVRVRDAEQIRASLGPDSRLRGLAFVPVQWQTCGGVYRVARHVRRIRDDHGRFRPVSGTVLLEGVTCAGSGPEPAGCGRHCPLWFRDEWLERVEAPRQEPPMASRLRHVRVRSVEEIRAGLDAFGRRDGLTFMPEMAEHAEKRFHAVQRLGDVFEYDAWVPTRAPIWILEGLTCNGRAAGSRGPCDRACALLWHEDWLVFEATPGG